MIGIRKSRSSSQLPTVYAMLAPALLPSTVFGQALSGEMSRTGTDQTGSVVPNAGLMLKNVNSGTTRESKSQSDGSSVFPNMLSRYLPDSQAPGAALCALHALGTLPGGEGTRQGTRETGDFPVAQTPGGGKGRESQRIECSPLKMDRGLRRVAIAVTALFYWGATFSLISGPAFAQDAEAGFKQGLQALRAGDKQKAVAVLEETLKDHPDHAPSHELLGLTFSALGNSAQALRHLREAVELWPDQAVYWTNLAIFYLGQSRTDEAEKALQQSLKDEPSPRAFRLLGLIRLDQHSGEEAVQLFKKALDLTRDDGDSWYDLGVAQESLAHSEEALGCYEEALKRAPGDFHTELQIGTLLLTGGRRQQALEHLRAAQAMRPQNPEVYLRLSEAYLGNGDLQQALESARRAVELMPDHREAHYQLGLALARLGKSEESRKEFGISERLPKKPEKTPLERWRELQEGASRSNEAKP